MPFPPPLALPTPTSSWPIAPPLCVILKNTSRHVPPLPPGHSTVTDTAVPAKLSSHVFVPVRSFVPMCSPFVLVCSPFVSACWGAGGTRCTGCRRLHSCCGHQLWLREGTHTSGVCIPQAGWVCLCSVADPSLRVCCAFVLPCFCCLYFFCASVLVNARACGRL